MFPNAQASLDILFSHFISAFVSNNNNNNKVEKYFFLQTWNFSSILAPDVLRIKLTKNIPLKKEF